MRRRVLAIVFVALAAFPAAAQQGHDVLMLDRERALGESAAAHELATQEREARVALRKELDELRTSLEAEEADIAALRDSATETEFEERVRAFDARVREARRASQVKGEMLQSKFVEARRALAESLDPVLQQILEETGASMIVDARMVFAAVPGVDITEEVIRRFDAGASGDAPAP